MRSLTVALAVCCVLGAAPLAGAMPNGATARGNAVTRLLHRVRLQVSRTWKRWSQPPSPGQALRPLQRMIDSGRISGGDLDRVRALYPKLGRTPPQPTIRSSRSDPRMQPLFRLLDGGRISRGDFVRIERALGR